MGLEERVAVLQERGERKMAHDLVTAVVNGAGDVDVTIEDDRVLVEHQRFSGTHRIATGPDGTPSVERTGEYLFEGTDGQFEMRLTTGNGRAVDEANALLEARARESEVDAAAEKPKRGLVERLQFW